MAEKQEQIVIVDGYSFLFRAYHSMPPLSNPNGIPVGAVYGFTSMIMRLLKDVKPSHIVVVFDSGSKNFRHDIYPEYKANRPPAPEDLIPQFPLVRDAAKALNISILEMEGYEADDVIATLANKALEKQEEVLIVSSDKDLMQLVNSHTHMYDAIKNKTIGEKEVEEKWGVKPSQMLDMLAMVGDSADNIPGLPGIGPKTAAQLLNQFESWERIYESSPLIKQNKRREVIQAGKEIVALSKSLVKLKDDLSLSLSFNDLKSRNIDAEELQKFLDTHNFKSLLARAKKDFQLSETTKENPSKTPTEIGKPDDRVLKIFTKHEELISFVNFIRNHSLEISIYLQTNFQNRTEVRNKNDVGAILIGCDQQVVAIPMNRNSLEQQTLLSESVSIGIQDVLEILKPILDDPSIRKVIYDLKSFLHIANENKIAITTQSFDDIMLMAYASGSGRMEYSFEGICEYYFGWKDSLQDVGGITKSNKKFYSLSPSETAQYYKEKIGNLSKLHHLLFEELFRHRSLEIYQNLELPLASVLFEMEKVGVYVNSKSLLELSQSLESELEVLESEIYSLAGKKFNIASPKQLSDILFNDMSIEPPKKSKTGTYSTNVEVLETLKLNGHSIADKLLNWRLLYKLKTTYADALPKQINPATGRIHTYFAQALTSTGRLSSSEPNLQNIPIRSSIGQKIRASIVAKEGFKLLSVDYSQIELRILAHIANIESLKNAFNHNIDIHSLTASEVFDIKLEDVTPDIRRKAKAINFGIIYGLSAFGLAKNINISRTEAAAYIDKYFTEYPGIKGYMDDTIKNASKHGYVKTIMGRRCYIKNINDKNYSLRSFAERAAINAPIQGSNADIIKKAMIEIQRKFSKPDEISMLLQVHDELIFTVREDLIEQYQKDICKIMKNVTRLDVPIEVESYTSKSWQKL